MTHLGPESLKRSIGRLREDVHGLLDRWMSRSVSGNGKLLNLGYGPPVEFEDRPDEVVVEIPGFDNKDVRIEVMDNRRILRGCKNMENDERGHNLPYGPWYERIPPRDSATAWSGRRTGQCQAQERNAEGCSFQDGECEGETNRGSSFVNAAQEIVRAEAELLRETLCFDAS
jgi:hypothetical protein